MGYSFNHLSHFYGGYLNEDNVDSIYTVLNLYITNQEDVKGLYEDINRLIHSGLSEKEIENITYEIFSGSNLLVYKIKDETSTVEWYKNFQSLIEELSATELNN